MPMKNIDGAGGKATRWRLPLFEGILPLDRSRVLQDVMAGVTLAAT